MSTWETLRLVTLREIVERGRSKAYIFSSIFTLVLIGGALAIPVMMDQRTESWDLGVVGSGNQEIVDSAVELGNADEDEGGVEIGTVSFDDVAGAERALEEGDIDAVLVDGAEVVTPEGSGIGGSGLEGLLQRAAAAVNLDEINGGSSNAAEILSEDPLEVRSLGELDPADTQARALVALGGLMLMYFAVLSYGNWTLMGVTEEKSNRVVEVLLATVEPWQLLAGKVAGIGLLGLAQFLFTVVVAVIGIRVTGVFELPAIPTASLPLLVLWFLLGYALYAVAYAAAGSLVSRMEDAQSVATPFTLVSIAGFMIATFTLDNPSGVLARVTTFLPPTAPFSAPVRAAFGAIPWWEMATSIALMVVTIVAMIRFAGRVYSGGLLRFGTKVSWKEAFQSAE